MADRSDTITVLRLSHNPVPIGQGFSVTANVSTAGPNRVHGDVEFVADGVSAATLRTDPNGSCTYAVPGGLMQPGEHEFAATFHGDGYNNESTSEALVVMLSPAAGEPWPAKGVDPKAPPTVEGYVAAGYSPYDYPASYAEASGSTEEDIEKAKAAWDADHEKAAGDPNVHVDPNVRNDGTTQPVDLSKPIEPAPMFPGAASASTESVAAPVTPPNDPPPAPPPS